MRACFGVHVCAHCLVGRCSSLLEESRCLHPSDGVEHAWAPQRMGDREVNQIFRHADADDDQKVRVVRENPRVRARARLCVCVRARAGDEDRDSTRSTSTHGAGLRSTNA